MRSVDDGELPVETYDDLLPALAEAIKEVPPPPCDNCIHAVRCALESLACLAFVECLNSPRGHYNSRARRAPTSAIFKQVFGAKRVRRQLLAPGVMPDL